MDKPKAWCENRPDSMDLIPRGKWQCCIGWDHIGVRLVVHRRVAISLAACRALQWGQRIELLRGEKMANSGRRGGCLRSPPCTRRPSALVAFYFFQLLTRDAGVNYLLISGRYQYQYDRPRFLPIAAVQCIVMKWRGGLVFCWVFHRTPHWILDLLSSVDTM